MAGDLAPFKDTYVTIIKEQEKRITSLRERRLQDLVTLKKSVTFNAKEEKVWEKRKTSEDFSNKLEDYVQKVSEEDFLDKPVFVERSPEMKQAEETIENETRKFIRKLSQILSEEDLKKLKDAKLISKSTGEGIEINKINNNMFKSETEIEKDIKDEGDDEDYISSEQYHIRLKQIATISYETVTALNRAKKDAQALYNKMVDQGDKKDADEFDNLLDQIKLRKALKAGKIKGEELASKEIIDVDDIQSFLQRILKRKYKGADDIRADQLKLSQLIKRLKDERGAEAERDLEDIQFLFDQWARKRTDLSYSEDDR